MAHSTFDPRAVTSQHAHCSRRGLFFRRPRFVQPLNFALLAASLTGALWVAGPPALARNASSTVPDMTGRYDFLNSQNTLALLQEDTELRGYIDVWQGAHASDTIFSYNLTIGSRHGNRVIFRTQRIHEKYYRFTGIVQRGKGKSPGDADYLELVGELQTITDNSVTGKPKIISQHVVFKEKSRSQAQQP